MMHEHGKSDSAIVAAKPTNKAGRPAAEPVERRAGTEGNAGQHSTRRAQYRESVSQALGHIRQIAKRALRRQTPEVGAVCGKSARTDLCGGRPVMDVPTAIPPASRIALLLIDCGMDRPWLHRVRYIGDRAGARKRDVGDRLREGTTRSRRLWSQDALTQPEPSSRRSRDATSAR